MDTVLLIAAVVTLFGVAQWFYNRVRYTKLYAQYAAVAGENRVLSKYRAIQDVERAVANARQQSEQEQSFTRDRIASQMAAANQDVERIVQQARQAAAEAGAAASARVSAANEESMGIVKRAHEQAAEIAGEALEAKRNLEVYKREVTAIKNIIAGYGHEYIVPSHGLLDDLAEGFSYADAGEKLKSARGRTRDLVKKGQAAACEYVDEDRRSTAIAFVVDAFNGKVDSILARVKADNVGKLRKEIVDACALVNLNGRAFRAARVTQEYVDSRLEELKWAVAVHDLKERERDEQRRIRDQIREEEKARREYERAIKEATKEEDGLKKAMDRVRKEVEKASEEQRAKYEAQLLELSMKLQVAEEKNQRALSMAQQTKTGHVYVISNIGSLGDEVFKIGLTRRLEPLDRIRELGDASVPFEFDVHALILSDDAPALERSLHRHFLAAQINKVNPRKEFFRVPLTVIRQEIEKLGIQASWTMAAAAAEYRESTAIDKAIQDNPARYDAWVNKQLVLDPVVLDDAEEDSAAVAAE
jgi:hypothetical protein